jgi:capsular polysaccharide biosynthesis protein
VAIRLHTNTPALLLPPAPLERSVRSGEASQWQFSDDTAEFTPAVFCEFYSNVYFNNTGEIFDEFDVLAASFPSQPAYNARDRARFIRKGRRAREDYVYFHGEYVWIVDRLSHFYFHWLCDCLPRLEALTRWRNAKLRLLLPARIHELPFVRQSLLAWPEIELVAPPKSSRNGKAERLIIPTRAAETPAIHPPLIRHVAQRLRDFFSGTVAQSPNMERIYFSRKNVRKRRVSNCAEVEKLFADNGFAIIQMDRLKLEEQIRLMKGARIIAGGHGGALTNMLFMNSGARILELRQGSGPPPCYYYLANALGHAWQFLACDPVDENTHPHANDIQVNLDKLEKALVQLDKD